MKLKPQDCFFNVYIDKYGDEDDEYEAGIFIFPKDKNHPLIDRLSVDDLETLPPYLEGVTEDAENLWMFEASPENVEKVRSDMIALGYELREMPKGEE